MSLFRRHKHTWAVKGRRSYTVMEKMIWESEWSETGDYTDIFYVCSECKTDRTRTVRGTFSLEIAKDVFPKP